MGGGLVAQVVSPLQPKAFLGFIRDAVQVIGVSEMGKGGMPERCRWAQVTAAGATVLLEVVGEPELRSSPCLRTRCGGTGRAGWTSQGAGGGPS